MPGTPQSNILSTRCAVIREYQPARIERELLAQVFDVAERGATLNEPGDQDRQDSDDPQRTGSAQPDAADLSNFVDQPRCNTMGAVA